MYPIDFFWRAVSRCPDRPAVVSGAGTLNFAALGELVGRRAAGLRSLDARMGSFVCLGAANGVDHLISILAILAADKVWVPLNPLNGNPELLRIIEFVGPSLVIVDETLRPRIDLAERAVRLIAEIDASAGRRSAIFDGTPNAMAMSLDRTQAVKFTGGTTGTPKGVQQPMRAWNANIVTQIHELGLKPSDRCLIAAPLTHGTSTYMLPVLAVGGALVFPAEAKPDALLDAAASHAVTLLFAPPTLIVALADAQRRKRRELPSLRYVIYGGAPMRPEQIVAAQGIFGPVLCTTYGQTEAPQIAAFLPPAELSGDDLRSVGRPTLMTQIAILDARGDALPPGEQGEIVIRGDLVMTGYYKAEEESSKVLVNGWLRTGDAGVFDDRGHLFIRDRLRDVIITGGFNVYPSDVEAVLASHPWVADCAVVGIPDSKWGEAVHAAVQVRNGAEVTPSEVIRFVKEQLGSVKAPKAVHIFDALPRSAVGKILKRAIRDEILRRGVTA